MKFEINILWFIILMASLGMFALQLQVSTLSTWIKGLLGLKQSYSSKLNVLGDVNFWLKYFGIYAVVLSPFILLMIVFFKSHKFISELVNCPYCSAFHLAWITNYFILNMTLLQAVVLAPFALIFVLILDKLHSL